jgi:hypothetical protein
MTMKMILQDGSLPLSQQYMLRMGWRTFNFFKAFSGSGCLTAIFKHILLPYNERLAETEDKTLASRVVCDLLACSGQ